jgi:ribosome-associated protein
MFKASMKDDVRVNHTLIIPAHELEITASRAGGPGGQHVNKTSSRITVRWNIPKSIALTPEQKERVLQKLRSQLTIEGDLIVHNSSSRSQLHNKRMALEHLATLVRKALHVPKKRKKTAVSAGAKEARLHEKSRRGSIKKMRNKKIYED